MYTAQLSEWQQRVIPELSLSAIDRQLVAEAGSTDGRLSIEELRSGVRISTTSWVGTVRLDTLEVQVLPKLCGGANCLAALIDFALDLGALSRREGEPTLIPEQGHLFDVVALLLAERCEEVVRRGLLSDYIEEEDALPVVRGRILADRQILERFGQVDRVICRYDERSSDIPENQLLLAAVAQASVRARTDWLRARLRRLRRALEESCSVPRSELHQVSDDIRYNRLNSHYKDAHAIARIVLEGLGVQDLYTPGALRSFSFLLDMNRLFELFVERLLRALIGPTFTLTAQAADSSIIRFAESKRRYATIRPDLLLRSEQSGTQLTIDAKYKLYDDRKVATSDIYQSFLYSYAFDVAAASQPMGMLMHPSSAGSSLSETTLEIVAPRGGALLHVVSLPIPLLLDELRGGEGRTLKELRELVVRCVEKQADMRCEGA